MTLLFPLARQRHVDWLRGGKEGLQAIVITLGEVIELVIMAARTANGQAQKRGTDIVGHFSQQFLAVLFLVLHAGIESQRTQPLHSGGHQGV